jgi:hypothetical protein
VNGGAVRVTKQGWHLALGYICAGSIRLRTMIVFSTERTSHSQRDDAEAGGGFHQQNQRAVGLRQEVCHGGGLRLRVVKVQRLLVGERAWG